MIANRLHNANRYNMNTTEIYVMTTTAALRYASKHHLLTSGKSICSSPVMFRQSTLQAHLEIIIVDVTLSGKLASSGDVF
jgi:hypothetical protein